MADPAVQAALDALAASRYLSDPVKRAKLIVAAVTPLIRAQALTEAEQAIRSLMDQQPLFDERDTWAHDVYSEALRAVRGLGEETASVDSKINTT